MARVVLTRHIFQFFPLLEGKELDVDGSTVAEIVARLETMAPGVRFYLCDERDRLRTHVNIFVDEKRVRDRARLSDPVGPDSVVHILQALSGG